MAIEQSRERVVSRIWQSIGTSGVDVSGVPRERLELLVGAIADGVLIEVDEMLDDTETGPLPESAPQPGLDAGEQELWQGRPFLSIGERYVVTSERVRVVRGLMSRDVEDIELFRLQDIDYTQKFGERLFNIGDLTLRSADASQPAIVLHNVGNPEKVHEILRRAMLEARKRHRVGFREEL